MEQTDYDIQALVETSAKGDAESYKKLYEHLVDKVYVYVRYRTSTEERATDLTQDVFIDLFTALSNFTYKSRAQFYAFVFVITKRKLAKHYAEVKAKESQTFNEETMSPTSAKQIDDETTNLDVEQALNHLEEQTREIVILHHWGRHTFGEIAEIMNMTESAARVRHHRALKTLAEKLEE